MSKKQSIIRTLGLGAWYIFLAIIALLAIAVALLASGFISYLLYTKVGWWCIPIILAGILFIILATIGSQESQR